MLESSYLDQHVRFLARRIPQLHCYEDANMTVLGYTADG
jgi:hypothetical protein